MRTVLLIVELAVLLAAAGDAVIENDIKAAYQVGDRLALAATTAPSGYTETRWYALVPKGWDAMKEFNAINLSKLKDSDPRATEALQKMRKLWDSAPVEPSLHGQRIRIPGFMVPLERKGDRLTEFLLVPYFGACIHTPPPPANQIIHVVVADPIHAQSMDPVWVSGTMYVAHTDSPMGASGYTMRAASVTPYVERR